jgi:hypothetical protein
LLFFEKIDLSDELIQLFLYYSFASKLDFKRNRFISVNNFMKENLDEINKKIY